MLCFLLHHFTLTVLEQPGCRWSKFVTQHSMERWDGLEMTVTVLWNNTGSCISLTFPVPLILTSLFSSKFGIASVYADGYAKFYFQLQLHYLHLDFVRSMAWRHCLYIFLNCVNHSNELLQYTFSNSSMRISQFLMKSVETKHNSFWGMLGRRKETQIQEIMTGLMKTERSSHCVFLWYQCWQGSYFINVTEQTEKSWKRF